MSSWSQLKVDSVIMKLGKAEMHELLILLNFSIEFLELRKLSNFR